MFRMSANLLERLGMGSLSQRLCQCLRAAFWIFFALILTVPAAAADRQRPLRIGVTPAFLHDQHALMADWREYLEQKLKRRVQFVQRDSYRETMDLVRQDQLDFAWICDYPLISLSKQVRLVAVPLYQGKPLYRSYVIVPANDIHTTSLKQLKGRVFAYADRYSNTGYLAPRYHLRESGDEPADFFATTFFTSSHRKVVEAVSVGLAGAGAVDSYVWETLALLKPELVRQTRVIWQSPEYAFPPFVATRMVNEAELADFQKVLLGMSADKEGLSLLRRLNLDGFMIGRMSMYDSVAKMMKAFGEL